MALAHGNGEYAAVPSDERGSFAGIFGFMINLGRSVSTVLGAALLALRFLDDPRSAIALALAVWVHWNCAHYGVDGVI